MFHFILGDQNMRLRFFLFLRPASPPKPSLLFTLLWLACPLPLLGQINVSDPPIAAKVPRQTQIHGRMLHDDYFWLRDREDPRVIDYLKAENEYTASRLRPTEAIQAQLFEEMRQRLKEDDDTVPARRGQYFYYSRFHKGKQYPVHCRKKGSLAAPEEILLDENQLAKGHEYFQLGVFRVSPDDDRLAYSVDTLGNERYALYVMDLLNGTVIDGPIRDTYYSVEWSADSRFLFYNTVDDASRPFRLFRHEIGTPPTRDVLVHEEKDEAYYLTLSSTRSREYLVLELASNTTTELRTLHSNSPVEPFAVSFPRVPKVQYKLDHRGEYFYVATNVDGAENFKVVVVSAKNTSPNHWKTILSHRHDVKIDDVDAFAGHLVISERESGYSQLRVIDFAANDSKVIPSEEPAHTMTVGENLEFKTSTLRYHYTSLRTPDSTFDHEMSTGKSELKKRTEVPGYNAAAYVCERLEANASDGARIPISVVYKSGFQRDGSHPLLLDGYGAYGISNDPTFDATRLSLLDRGFVFALAHVRGGGDLGRRWYEEGKLLKKKNTFTDFLACADALVSGKYTSRDRLAIQGVSAGGLLIGAVLNERPDACAAAIAEVPFVDLINTMLDASIPLTVTEWEEWGNPHLPAFFDYMFSYSPYDQVHSKRYPAILATASLNDPRVGYWEPAKWVAKLRATNEGARRVLLKTNLEAGHSGASGRYDSLKDRVLQAAFLLHHLPSAPRTTPSN
ncbi:MAG: S9 family peptidase [Planctomycetota bacterium]